MPSTHFFISEMTFWVVISFSWKSTASLLDATQRLAGTLQFFINGMELFVGCLKRVLHCLLPFHKRIDVVPGSEQVVLQIPDPFVPETIGRGRWVGAGYDLPGR